MQLIEYGGAMCAIGLQWEVTTAGEFTRRQLVKRGRTYRASHFLAHQTTGPSGGGLVRSYGFGKFPKLSKSERKAGVFGLASVIARLHGDSCCVAIPLSGEGDPEERIGFIGVLQGMPAPGLDVVGDRETVTKIAQGFLDQNGIARYHYLPEFGDPVLKLDNKPSAEFEFTAAGGSGEIDESCKLEPIPSGAFLLVASLGLVVSIGLFVGLVALKQKRDEEEMRARNAVSPEEAYRQTRDQEFTAGARIAANSAFSRLASVVLGLSPTARGWLLDRVVCESRQAQEALYECVITWTPDGGTYETFKSPIKGGKVTYDANLSQVKLSLPISLSGVRPLLPMDIGNFPDSLEFVQRTGSVLQDLKVLDFKPTLSSLKAVGSLQPGMIFSTGLHSMQWELVGPVDDMELAMAAFPPSMTLDKLEFTVPRGPDIGGLRITTSGVAYVR